MPHPEEHREAVRLEGWEPVVLLPTLRDAALWAAPQGEVVVVAPYSAACFISGARHDFT